MVKVSVIIPTYGNPDLLNKSIQSVVNQSFSEWELIIVDDNNPNTPERQATEKVIKKYSSDSRIHYIQHPQNLNGAVARNTGIKIASGKYLAFLDSDDEYSPDRLNKCYKAMQKQSEKVAAVYTGCKFKRGGKTYHIETNVKSGNFLVQTLACTFMFCTGSNLFIRKSVVDEIKGFDPAFLRHQDYEFLVRVFKQYDIVALPKVLVTKNNDNVNLPGVKKMIDIKHQYLEKYRNDIISLSKSDQDYIYHSQWISIGEAAQKNKDYTTAKQYYNLAAKYGRLSIKERSRRLAFRLRNSVI